MAFKIYTKTGDDGTTGLFGGTRVAKDDLRVEAYGTVDELNSFVGLVRDLAPDTHTTDTLKSIQDTLFALGAHLATAPDASVKTRSIVPALTLDDITLLEQEIDRMDALLPALTHFILPGGHVAVSYCHVARCVCRRAERLAVTLAGHHEEEEKAVERIALQYLNRLSDYLFTLARYYALALGITEIKWQPRDKSTSI